MLIIHYSLVLNHIKTIILRDYDSIFSNIHSFVWINISRTNFFDRWKQISKGCLFNWMPIAIRLLLLLSLILHRVNILSKSCFICLSLVDIFILSLCFLMNLLSNLLVNVLIIGFIYLFKSRRRIKVRGEIIICLIRASFLLNLWHLIVKTLVILTVELLLSYTAFIWYYWI